MLETIRLILLGTLTFFILFEVFQIVLYILFLLVVPKPTLEIYINVHLILFQMLSKKFWC